MFENHTVQAASKGSPLEWLPMNLVPNNVGSAAIAPKPPPPHGGVWLADMLLGPDGQKASPARAVDNVFAVLIKVETS